MGNWFGDLDLAYKYTVVFVSLLVLVFVAGLIKIFFDRRKIKKFTEEQNVETGRREDQVELNQREKDEGDLFGIRAIEAGFYAGIPQSRPTSRAGSVIASPSMSSSTLIGGQSLNTPKLQSHSMNSSVTTLPLAHTNERYRDSDVLPVNDQSRRKSPPTIKLQPSEAEMNGRINHTTTVNMTLNVPPSPVSTRHQTPSPTFGSSDDGDISPRSANFAEHYAPAPPQIPMPDGLRVAVHPPESTAQSQTASLAGPSANSSSRSSLGQGPETKLPSMPSKAMMDDARAEAWVQQSNKMEFEAQILQPVAYQPSHQRDLSSTSSIYSDKRRSEYQSLDPARYNKRESVAPGTNSGSLLAPAKEKNDPRFSDFYDSYYRQSQYGAPTEQKAAEPGMAM